MKCPEHNQTLSNVLRDHADVKNRGPNSFLWGRTYQHTDTNRARHLWATIYQIDVQVAMWRTGGSRNQARLVDHGHSAWREKSRSVHTSRNSTAEPQCCGCWAVELRYTGDWRPSRNTPQTCTGTAALDHFKETVITDEDGHYEVSWFYTFFVFWMLYSFFWVISSTWNLCTDMLEHSVSSIFMEDWNDKYKVFLTWLESDEALQANLDVVRKRCVSTTTRLLA